jgi:hypothetical protein
VEKHCGLTAGTFAQRRDQMKIHYYGKGGEAEAGRISSALGRKAGNAAFIGIHYNGDQTLAAAGSLAAKGGQAAALDIHYHGDQAMDVATPALKTGQAAALDIHYHGDQAMGGLAQRAGMMGESAQAEGGLMSSSSAVATNALRDTTASGGVSAPKGGSAAFLDIHYHGSQVEDLANPARQPGGTQAFLDIHYHGDQAALEGLTQGTAIPGKGGQAAFLDIHYHGDQAALGGLMREGSWSGGAVAGRAPANVAGDFGGPTLPPKGSAAFIDIHYHGKQIGEADVKGAPGLHIGDAALLDIHYHG